MTTRKISLAEAISELADITDVSNLVYTTDIPKRTQKPYRGRIGSWRRIFIAPGRYCITGKVFGNPDRANGSTITTSLVEKKDGQRIETMNSRYRLIGK